MRVHYCIVWLVIVHCVTKLVATMRHYHESCCTLRSTVGSCSPCASGWGAGCWGWDIVCSTALSHSVRQLRRCADACVRTFANMRSHKITPHTLHTCGASSTCSTSCHYYQTHQHRDIHPSAHSAICAAWAVSQVSFLRPPDFRPEAERPSRGLRFILLLLLLLSVI